MGTSLDLVHRLRSCSSCVLVGKKTVQDDDCSLTVRRCSTIPDEKQPIRVIIDTNLSILKDEKEYKVLYDGLRTIIYYSSLTAIPSLSDTILEKNSKITLVPIKPEIEDDDNQKRYKLNPKLIMNDLYKKRNINHIMIEGGPNTARQFLKLNLIDRAIMVHAPISFDNGIHSNINDSMLIDSDLCHVHTVDSDGDTIKYWVRNGLSWPSNVND